MKAISLWQPWASLWCSPFKVHETRHWYTPHRGQLLVHAAKKLVSDCGEDLDDICILAFGPYWRTQLARGAIIGMVSLVKCVPTEELGCGSHKLVNAQDFDCGDFSEGRFAWRRDENFIRFFRPVPFIGRQGFFEVPDELVSDQIARAA